MKATLVWLSVAAIVALVAGRVTAGEPPSFPLIWQSRSAPNGDRIDVTRMHDPEAGVNCYVASGPGHARIELSSPSGANNATGHITSIVPSISCVKVR